MLSYSTVDQLCRDPKMLLRFAHAEDIIPRKPTGLLVTTQEARRKFNA
jgi:hypothetical protein